MLRLIAAAITLAGQAASAASIATFSDRATFEAVAGAGTVVDFEGIAPDGSFVEVPGYSESGAVFDTSPEAGRLIIADAGNSPGNTFGAPYASDIAFATLPYDVLVVTLPAGIRALGGEFGDLFEVADLRLTLRGAGGVLSDQFFPAAPGFGFGSRPNFYGWLVEGDEIRDLTITGVFEAADNVMFAVPEPASGLLVLLG